jgi:hypothetical protein
MKIFVYSKDSPDTPVQLTALPPNTAMPPFMAVVIV